MRAIVAIGGGNLAAGETLAIDRTIVSLSEKVTPSVLFLPTASHDSRAYVEEFTAAYHQLGCTVKALLLWENAPDAQTLRETILSSDIIYVGGGDTEDMLRVWHETGVDVLLKEAWECGIVLSGLSAGALCWFHRGLTDRMVDGQSTLVWCDGLGLIPYHVGPHYDEEFWSAFDDFMPEADRPGIALENNTALMMLDDRLSILHSSENNHAWLLRPENGTVRKCVYEGGFI